MKRSLLFLTLVLAAAVLAGCNSSSTLAPIALGTGNGDGGGAVTGTVGDQALNNLLPLDESADPLAAGMMGGLNGPDEIVDPELGPARHSAGLLDVYPDTAHIVWWRKVDSFTSSFNKSGTSDSVYVTARRTNTGEFEGKILVPVERNSRARSPRPAWRDSLLYSKPYSMAWSRSAIFSKAPGDSGEEGTHWALQGVTLDKGVQVSPTTPVPVITRVVVTADGPAGPVSVTFDDPDRMLDVTALPQFKARDTVLVQVFTDGTDATQRAYIHFDVAAANRGRCWRRPLAYNTGTGAFEGGFVVRPGFGRNHRAMVRPRSAVWVDVLSKATVYDSTAPCSASCWGVPYWMAPFAPVRTGHR